MKNKVAELFGVMITNEGADTFFREGWLALYNDIMDDPIKAMREGEKGGFLNTVCTMALLDWYEHKHEVR